MKSILTLIEEKQQVYSQLPFFEFLSDQSISPEQKLAFAPCAAPFIMGFSDLCKYTLRQEPTKDKIQLILNQHTYEDDFHWQWFLEDLQKLGFNGSYTISESLDFLWSEATKNSRLLTYKLYKWIAESEPLERLVILESIEATADIFLSLTSKAANQLKNKTEQEYRYFGDCHANQEDCHSANSSDTSKIIACMYLSKENKQKAQILVERVFALFTDWTYELLAYAQAQRLAKTSSHNLKYIFHNEAA
ncbi:MAG: hypothetical protein AAFY63_00700 [Cyanobacteria bacterium J06643_13]